MEREQRGGGRRGVVPNTRVLLPGNGVGFLEEAFSERVPLGRSAVEKVEKLAEPGQADTAGSRLRRNLIGYVYAGGSPPPLRVYIYIYTPVPRVLERGKRSLFSIVESPSENLDSKSRVR